jgi:hypothetical protein
MKLVMTAIVLSAAIAVAQTCLVPAPIAPPRANQIVINLPVDGGTIGCTGYAVTTTGGGSPNSYPVGNAKCSTARQMADQMVANDNGWNDGGAP